MKKILKGTFSLALLALAVTGMLHINAEPAYAGCTPLNCFPRPGCVFIGTGEYSGGTVCCLYDCGGRIRNGPCWDVDCDFTI